ncbi:MAG: hypothetical protein AAGA21_08625 [Pseudomonadota bacterium]
MATRPPPPPGAAATDNTMLHVTYGLFAVSFLIGVAAIVAVVLAYLQRGKPLNEMQASHVEWQIRTFWWGLLFAVIGFITPFLLGSMFVGMLVFGLMLVWYIYRIAKGWLWLKDSRTVDDPTALI